MRPQILALIAATASSALLLASVPVEAQERARTRITVQPKSYLDPGTKVKPGERDARGIRGLPGCALGDGTGFRHGTHRIAREHGQLYAEERHTVTVCGDPWPLFRDDELARPRGAEVCNRATRQYSQ